ncbi:hypothetical protein PACTADRAFT_3554 [Pachysolen tannophilus NRRL Y-2460]|uniref:Uncharacterized protein n=1 Tax=Pachysolen tannophilus NRRL Y-2460 TaxID=669874 RepID=A0A1E4TSF0_PACTA|nr:hypothetical protein PACTADRAFT_3554 [Pachysolen tannophilus NRRL Y-2460]
MIRGLVYRRQFSWFSGRANKSTSNISNVLNEINNEGELTNDGGDSKKTYKTTASQLFEELKDKEQEAVAASDGANSGDGVDEKDSKLLMKKDVSPEEKQDNGNDNGNEDSVVVENKIERYIDTNLIYNKLREAEFTAPQSKLVLKILLTNLSNNISELRSQFANDTKLSNETYLFEAAQQEMKLELSQQRFSKLNDLAYNSIILKRIFTNIEDELFTSYKLTDNGIKLELNQFKHENNLHLKMLNLKNHDLNNKIISELVGNLKSHIESLRWQLTRSALVTILIAVFGGITGYTIVKNNEEVEEETEEIKLN